MRLVSSSQASPRFDLVSMLSFPVVFASLAPATNYNDRINMVKRGELNSDSEMDLEQNNKVTLNETVDD